MKFLKLAASAALAVAIVPAAAHAQAATAGATAGATVYDPQGGEVGTIASVVGGNVVIDTGNNKATIPGAAVTKGPKGPQIAYTKAQLDAAIEAAAGKAQAALQQALVEGAAVSGKDGAAIGTVKEVQDANVVVARTDGTLVALPKSAFTVAANGLQISMTAEQLAAQVQASKPAPGAAPASGSAASAPASGAPAASR
ncbi:MAG: hypothetical protein KGL48_15380 [Sphingomonadales bacterium]|nr:hypothetical protein [Sphingomonadales bacterium]MDE2567550.1 hypothetical protein [Sphingomonadales bacterium]